MTENILAGLVGLVVGSLLNVVITGLTQDGPLCRGRIRCPYCHHTMPWRDLLPLLSYVLLKGRCRFCGEPVSWRYPSVEVAAGLLALALWRRFPGSALLWVYGPFTAALLILTVLDFQHFWLPDAITLPGTVLGLMSAPIFPHLGFGSAFLGAVLGYAVFQVMHYGYEKVTKGKRQGLGAGDAKLMAFIGAVLGLKALPWVLFSSAVVGSLVGLMVARRSSQGRFAPIPYGPCLVLGALSFLFWKT